VLKSADFEKQIKNFKYILNEHKCEQRSKKAWRSRCMSLARSFRFGVEVSEKLHC